jgi:uncharacterized membrane protein
MHKGRLEAFSDGVIAIIITIMVLELKVPHGPELSDLRPLIPVFISYILSFINVAIYWNNHHHMLQASEKVNGRILWANMHLLFWLSLIPFTTAWMGENHFPEVPVALYGANLFMCGVAYYLLSHILVLHHGRNSTLAKAIGDDFKGKISVLIYAIAIPVALYLPWISYACYFAVAIMWLIPDRRIEEKIEKN